MVLICEEADAAAGNIACANAAVGVTAHFCGIEAAVFVEGGADGIDHLGFACHQLHGEAWGHHHSLFGLARAEGAYGRCEILAQRQEKQREKQGKGIHLASPINNNESIPL